MQKFKLPHDSIVLIADGRKALFLRNEGDGMFPNLVTARVFKDINPPTREQGSDRPGRVHESLSSRRSGIEGTDWHTLEEHKFVAEVTAALERYVRDENPKKVILVAPPRVLGDLRSQLAADVKKRVVAEIEKDLTKHPVNEIEKYLLDSAEAG
ncbi:MAG: host attachment protein [Xanthobacteraceae bacterium]|nr:host attachment protein [Xanthobacteraceae bacterium]